MTAEISRVDCQILEYLQAFSQVSSIVFNILHWNNTYIWRSIYKSASPPLQPIRCLRGSQLTTMPHTGFALHALVSGAAILLSFPLAARSDIMDIGVLSFDVLIPPAGVSSGVNAFDIYNFTGDPNLSGYALPPDFPVLNFVTLQNASLLFNGTGSPVALSDIAPGQLGSAPLFPGDTLFTSALFTATLSETVLSLDGGGTFIADPTISATLLPSSGPDLVAGTDLVVLQATGTLYVLPEPGAAALMAFAIIASLAIARRRRRVRAH
jgi:hypothetical protein